MYRKTYKCVFLSNVILTSEAGTEGYSRLLEYVPGAKFLGIVASNIYNNVSNDEKLNFFHNGNVKFGDAHLLYGTERSFAIPFNWYLPKDHSINDAVLSGNRENNQLYSQVKCGYFANELKLKFNTISSIKSGYDRENKTAKDGEMFTYNSYAPDSEWGFHIDYKNEDDIEIIENNLLGCKRIGRSKSAEYGLVEISSFEFSENKSRNVSDLLYLYAESNLCFVNNLGAYTSTITPEMFNLPSSSTIDWERSFIRTRLYYCWNSYRNNNTEDRIIVEKGSVFCVKTDFFNSVEIESGVGVLLSEGFGKVICNPSFVINNPHVSVLKKTALSRYRVIVSHSDNNELLKYLKKRKNISNSYKELDNSVNKYVIELSQWQLTPSQWSKIRLYANASKNWDGFMKLIFDKDFGMMFHGQMESVWLNHRYRFENLLKKLEGYNEEQKLDFVIKLVSILSKKNNDEV